MVIRRIAVLAVLLSPAALAAQTDASVPSSRSPWNGAHVSIDLGSATAEFDARSFELAVAQPAGKDAPAVPTLPELHLVKRAGPYTGALVQASASGQHAPTVTLSVPDSTGAPGMTIVLSDVVLATDRLVLTNARAGLEQQRIAQEASLAQLTSDYQEAQRQLSIAEQLGKSRVTTPQDLSRAREHAAAAQQRLDLARRSYAMLEDQLAAQGPLDEELTLRFARIEINGAEPGAHGAWDFTAVAPTVQRRPRQ